MGVGDSTNLGLANGGANVNGFGGWRKDNRAKVAVWATLSYMGKQDGTVTRKVVLGGGIW